MDYIAEPDILLLIRNIHLEDESGRRVGGMQRMDILYLEKFRLLDLYVKRNYYKMHSPEFIDRYTKAYKLIDDEAKGQSSVHLIRDQILDIRSNPEIILPEKYQTVNKQKSNDEKYTRIRKELLAQIDIRSNQWVKRIT